MNTQEKIIKYLRRRKEGRGRELSELLGISRQAVNKHLKELIQSGRVVKRGITRGSIYSIAPPGKQPAYNKKWRKTYKLAGLEEDLVLEEAELCLNFKSCLQRNVRRIVRYGLTEMVNNSIDHSRSSTCLVEVDINQYDLTFKVRDFGRGVFHTIRDKYNLADEYIALGELIKGKTTTMRERHTGEGIFFTSKVADLLFIRSHKINLIFNNLSKDVFVEEPRFLRGSEVTFRVSRKSRKRLSAIFHQYAPEEYDFEFNRTRVAVKLFKEDYMSRSEAKRLVSGLDKFKEITLDFKGVKSIGQGFADEIFRIFQNRHPDIVIRVENLSPSLAPMIRHVVDNRKFD